MDLFILPCLLQGGPLALNEQGTGRGKGRGKVEVEVRIARSEVQAQVEARYGHRCDRGKVGIEAEVGMDKCRGRGRGR